MFEEAPSATGRSRRHIARSILGGSARRVTLAGVLTLAVAVLIALLPGLSSGKSLQEKVDTKREKLEQVEGRVSHLTTTVSALGKRIRGLEREIGSLRSQQAKAESVLAARRAELSRVTARYRAEHARFVRLRERLRRAQIVLAERLVAIYKADTPDFVTVILESDGFQDMLVRGDYMSRIGQQDSLIVDRVRELKAQVARKRALLVDLKRRAERAVEIVEAKRRQLVQTRTAIQSRQVELASTRSKQKQALNGAREHRDKLEGDLSKLSAKVAAQLGSGPVPAGPIRQGGGQFIWPVNGPITSPFCEKRSWESCHPGIDIGVGSGTPIRAAGSGTVAMAGPYGGYGNYTCISHGGGLSTCYAHQSAIKVSSGQSVSKGQVIGLVGCTGLCFGAHLHFEVRVGGAVVNPLGYL